MSSLEGRLSRIAGEQRVVLGGPRWVVLERRRGEEDLACLGVVVDGHNRKAAVGVAGSHIVAEEEEGDRLDNQSFDWETGGPAESNRCNRAVGMDKRCQRVEAAAAAARCMHRRKLGNPTCPQRFGRDFSKVRQTKFRKPTGAEEGRDL